MLMHFRALEFVFVQEQQVLGAGFQHSPAGLLFESPSSVEALVLTAGMLAVLLQLPFLLLEIVVAITRGALALFERIDCLQSFPCTFANLSQMIAGDVEYDLELPNAQILPEQSRPLQAYL